MSDAQIKNVEKDRDGDITHVGVSGDWKWTVAQVVTSIESGTNTFYVMCPQRANVVVRSTAGGHASLRRRRTPPRRTTSTTSRRSDAARASRWSGPPSGPLIGADSRSYSTEAGASTLGATS